MKRRNWNLGILTVLFGVELCPSMHAAAQVPGPDETGQWELPTLNWPLQANHMIVLKNGKVLCLNELSARLWDPLSNTFSGIISMPTQRHEAYRSPSLMGGAGCTTEPLRSQPGMLA